jgi:hypothetical protein
VPPAEAGCGTFSGTYLVGRWITDAIATQVRRTAASTAKHEAAAVLHHDNQSSLKETIMVPATLPAPAAKATPTIPSILALDLGTTTGWAVRTSRCRIVHGTAEFRPSRFEGGGMRYLRFGKWLEQTLEITGGIDAVYFEEVRRHIGTDASHVFGGLLATLTSWCEQHGLPYQGVPVGTWKRHACGKGNADKRAVIDAMRARGFQPADDNEADAIAILLWVLETNGGLA